MVIFTAVVFYMPAFLDGMFYRVEPAPAPQSTVFVMEMVWIIVFKVRDQWQNIGWCLLWCGGTREKRNRVHQLKLSWVSLQQYALV